MNLTNVIKDLKELVFKSKTSSTRKVVELHNTIVGISDNHKYIFLCEVQKWLRDEHKFQIEVTITISNFWVYSIYDLTSKRNAEVKTNSPYYNSYEEALLAGIEESVKLIKNTPA